LSKKPPLQNQRLSGGSMSREECHTRLYAMGGRAGEEYGEILKENKL